MNKLFIIGNGFDLAHGLKTSYEDFLLWYLIPATLEANEKGYFEDDNLTIAEGDSFQKINSDWLKKCTNLKELVSLLENKGFKITYKSNFFESLVEDGISRWVDIENTYYQELKMILKIYKNSDTPDELILLNKTLDSLRDKLVVYLKEYFSDKSFNLKRSPFYLVLRNKYPYDVDLTKVIDGDFNEALKQSKSLFLNFNYTPLIKKYFDLNFSKDGRFNFIQIHGSMENPESIVFGFGDEIDEAYQEMERKNNNEFFKHIKSFKYFQDENYQKLMAFINGNEPFEVVVLGHSLGLSDRTMLSQIFEHENLEKVQLYYYEDADGNNDFTEKTYEISRHFSNKGRMRLKVVPLSKSEKMPKFEMDNNKS